VARRLGLFSSNLSNAIESGRARLLYRAILALYTRNLERDKNASKILSSFFLLFLLFFQGGRAVTFSEALTILIMAKILAKIKET
jgi:hypothetical protein